MSFEMLRAELNQARAAWQKAMGERETYIRVVACLASYISAGKQIPMVDGHPVIYAKDFNMVPKLWSVNIVAGELEEPEAEAPPAAPLSLVGPDGEGPVLLPEDPVPGDPGPVPEKKLAPALVIVVNPKLEGPRLVVPKGVPNLA